MKRVWISMLVLSALLAATPLAQAQGWTTLGPVPRFSHTVVYDPGSDTAILFGGQAAGPALLNDVWTASSITPNANVKVLDLVWALQAPTGTAPAPRFAQTGVYAAGTNRLLIYGGSTGVTPVCSGEYWSLNGANGVGVPPSWTKVTPLGTAPTPRMAHTAVYDAVNDIMVIFGGYDCAGHYLADVWAMTNASGAGGSPTWTQVNVSGSGPAARQYASAVYDPNTNRMIIYGGDSGGSPWGDAWYLTNANGRGGTASWTQLTPTGTAPSARTGQAAYYDSVNNRMMFYGGFSSGTLALGDTWILINANGNGAASWSKLNAGAVGTAPTRRNHAVIYDVGINTIFMFGGINGATASSSTVDDHAFVLSVANGLP